MIEILNNTPTHVWPILALLIWSGWKSIKTQILPWTTLCIMPAVMFVWAVYSQMTNPSIPSWAIHFGLGIWIGAITTRKLQLKFDKKKKLVEFPGTWAPMLLSVSIYSLRYFLGVIHSLHPELQGNTAIILVENLATFISGICIGRFVGYCQLYKKTPHEDLGGVIDGVKA